MTDTLKKLTSLLEVIRDTALEVHEQFERKGCVPLFDLERFILGPGRCFEPSVRATMLWHILVFTRARIRSQQEFQQAVSAKLPSAECALLVRHLMCSAPRTWSYRHSYQRSFAHMIAGPKAHAESSVDACVSGWGNLLDADHSYVLGWTIPFNDRTYLIYAQALAQSQVYEIEKYKPFPVQLNEDDFWEENLLALIERIYEPEPCIATSVSEKPTRTDYAPELVYDRLSRVIQNALSSSSVRMARALYTTVAQGNAQEILSTVDTTLASLHIDDDAQNLALRRRLLEAIGCDSDGAMPHAHGGLLASDPVALLLLPESLDLLAELSPRESIKKALSLETKYNTNAVSEAFQTYQCERRWLAAFPSFDFSREDHAIKFGLPVDALSQIFDPRLMNAVLPFTPQGDTLRQLQNRYGYFINDNRPTFGDVLKVISAKTFVKTGNMSNIIQYIMNCCDRWRYCLCAIEPENSTRMINQANKQLLHKGLSELSSLFKKT